MNLKNLISSPLSIAELQEKDTRDIIIKEITNEVGNE